MPKILVSDRAQMVMSYHILFDQCEEERLGKHILWFHQIRNCTILFR